MYVCVLTKAMYYVDYLCVVRFVCRFDVHMS